MKKYSYKGKIVTADSKEEAIKIVADNNDFESYKKEFEKYWKPKYDEFYKVVNSCKFVRGSMWLTDCDSDFDKFAGFAFKEGFSIKECPIECDYWIKDDNTTAEDRIRKNHFGEVVLKEEMYDEQGGTWRNEDCDRAISCIKTLEEACNKYF